jgi:hypothetical protein
MNRAESIEVYKALELEDTGDLQVIRAMINNIFAKRGITLIEQTLVTIEFDDGEEVVSLEYGRDE